MEKKKVEKESLNNQPRIYKKREITKTEKEILHLITDEFLTLKQIAQRRYCSLQAVYKILKKLKEKGLLDIGMKKVEKVESTFNQNDIRLHGQEINIRILWQDNKYQERLEKSNTLFLDGNTIRLYKNSIEIYSGQSFYGKKIEESEKKSLEYLGRFLARLEHELKVGILKNRARNIKIVNQHYARGDSEICDNSIKNRERVWVYAEEDGKLCFITDDSFGFREDETLHPITAKQDRKEVDKQVNDWRLNNPPTNSELNNNIKFLSESMIYVQKDLPLILNDLKIQIESHLLLIKEYRKENILWRKTKEKEFEKNIKKIKNQKRLGEWL